MDYKLIKEKLEKEKKELKLMLDNLIKETEEAIKETVSSSDEIADKFEYKEEKHLQEDAFRERLKKIDDAIFRIEQGIYGLCLKCKKGIEKERLEIDPTLELCRSCSLPLKK